MRRENAALKRQQVERAAPPRQRWNSRLGHRTPGKRQPSDPKNRL